jgi:hypothetical protein
MDRMSAEAAKFDFTANRTMHNKFSRNNGSFGLPDGFGDLMDPTKMVDNLKMVGNHKKVKEAIAIVALLLFLYIIWPSSDDSDKNA